MSCVMLCVLCIGAVGVPPTATLPNNVIKNIRRDSSQIVNEDLLIVMIFLLFIF